MYAVVRGGAAVITFASLPREFAAKTEAEQKAAGVYEVVDQRSPLSAGETYGTSVYAFTGTSVTRTAPVNPAPAPTQAELDRQTARTDGPLVSLRGMTPAQVRTWVAANVTTLADARQLLATLAVAVSVLARRL